MDQGLGKGPRPIQLAFTYAVNELLRTGFQIKLRGTDKDIYVKKIHLPPLFRNASILNGMAGSHGALGHAAGVGYIPLLFTVECSNDLRQEEEECEAALITLVQSPQPLKFEVANKVTSGHHILRRLKPHLTERPL